MREGSGAGSREYEARTATLGAKDAGMKVRGWAIAGTVVASALLAMSSSAQSSGVAAGASAAARAERVRPPARGAAPVVVELFTAQGCGGCVEANAVVERAAAEPGVIALT